MTNRKGSAPGILRFQLESEILRRIAHPRVPRFVETFSEGEVHYIVQQFIDGPPLSYLLATGYRFSEGEVKGILKQLLDILDILHCPSVKENAVVHRDLRLSNLLLQNGKLYLVDFGLARFLDLLQFPFFPDPLGSEPGESAVSDSKLKREVQRPGLRVPGVDTYCLLRREIAPRSDLFGVGVVAVDLFSNLVEDESQFELDWDKVLPLSGQFVGFLKKLLSKNDGFETAAEALKHLKSMSR